MIEKLIQRLAAIARIHRRVDKLAQVFDPRVRFGCVLALQQLDVTGAVNQELEQLGRGCGTAWRAETFDSFVCAIRVGLRAVTGLSPAAVTLALDVRAKIKT